MNLEQYKEAKYISGILKRTVVVSIRSNKYLQQALESIAQDKETTISNLSFEVLENFVFKYLPNDFEMDKTTLVEKSYRDKKKQFDS